MNQQERQALQDFLQELAQARLAHKDAEADAMISQAIARQPHAAYLLVQRILLQEQALDAAQHEIAALQTQLDAVRTPDNQRFLDPGSGWGLRNRAMARAANAPPVQSRAAYDLHTGAYHAPAARPGLLSGGAGSFLGSMAATAAGVAAGSFLFHGIDQLLHPHDAPDHAASQGLADDPGSASQLMDETGFDNGSMASDAGFDDIGGFDDAGGFDQA